MTKATLTKIIGTIATATIAGSATMLPEQYRPLALALAGLTLGWLHLPRPGDAKAAS